MKNFSFRPYFQAVTFCLMICFLLIGCSKDDGDPDDGSQTTSEINTMRIKCISADGQHDTTFQAEDPDGDGPLGAIISDGILRPATTYSFTVTLSNTLETPTVVITPEVIANGNLHQIFYQFGGDLNINQAYDDMDALGNPIGLTGSFTTGAPSHDEMTVTLLNSPAKTADGVSDGDISNAGGEVGLTATFDLFIQ